MQVAFCTFGCKVNQAESRELEQAFSAKGCAVIELSAEVAPDWIIINSCAVTHAAERKARNLLRRLNRDYPLAKLILCGCYANIAEQELAKTLPEVDCFITGSQKFNLESWPLPWPTQQAADALPNPARKRQFLKIQDGCDCFCSYCVIPYARPQVSSLAPEAILQKAEQLLRQGAAELIVTGINLGRYRYKELVLTDILKRLADLPGLKRLRISSLEPNFVTAELLNCLNSIPQAARHLHLPLQSGSDKILKLMQRNYSVAEYRQKIELVRQLAPKWSITTDLIVGFPQEEESDFAKTINLVKELQFSSAHLFRFSARPFTEAAKLKGRVDSQVVNSRFAELQKVIERLTEQHAQRFVGKTIKVLLERFNPQDGFYEGHSSEYLKVLVQP